MHNAKEYLYPEGTQRVDSVTDRFNALEGCLSFHLAILVESYSFQDSKIILNNPRANGERGVTSLEVPPFNCQIH